MKITILGCGASGGVPLIGCECVTCQSGDPKNNRTRASILIEEQGKRLLVDTSPDLRQQALRHKFSTVDAIFYTHAHADHMMGIDDVRAFNFHANAAIPTYSDAFTLKLLQNKFSYAFEKPSDTGIWFRPSLTPHIIDERDYYAPIQIAGLDVTVFPQAHGTWTSLGIRIGDFAYSTDCNALNEAAFKALEGVDTWVVDCLRAEEAPTHAGFDVALSWIYRVKPKRSILSHMSHTLEYAATRDLCPDGVEPAYDGMVIECS